MEAFRPLLLDVWREVCRHIEIQEAAANIAVMLSKQLPLAAMLVRRIEAGQATVDTAAAASVGNLLLPPSHEVELTRPQLRKLHAWGRERQVVVVRAGGNSREFAHLVPPDIREEILVGPLLAGDRLHGALILVSRQGQRFDATHRRLAQALLDPLSVALDNDRRVRELTTLRQAAEADRRSLLARLGRQELGDTIVGADSGLKPVMERVALVAPSDVPVLLLGETGSGKEVIARAIHARSQRSAGPFMRVNCGAIPSELIDSQLFGHEKGSFTGASETRQGWFERADCGTLFLDEIGELPLAAQVRLLRVLQDGNLERVGGQQPVRVDVRIVAATHRDLATMVQHKEFREDLWYRLAVFPILLPPLRERTEDIPALARHFAQRAATRFNLSLVLPTPDDVALLSAYHWPGNIRELATVIDRAAILGNGKQLEVTTALGIIPSRHTDAAKGGHQANVARVESAGIGSLAEATRQHIERALRTTRGRIEGTKGAAALLKINPHTLRAKMRKLKIDWAQFRD